MTKHQRFSYGNLKDLKADIASMELDIPLSDNIDVLKESVKLEEKVIPNRLAIHPMEGADGTSDGKPDELTYRRYDRFARGNAGLLWIEATAVTPDGRANPRQLYICRDNLDAFHKMYDGIIGAAQEEFGHNYRPYTVLQLTHSGRYSKPQGKPAPIIATRNPYLDNNIPEDYPIITDDQLEKLEDRFVDAAVLASEVGFDAVDIKSCHRYLISELFSAFTREGKYGGSFENRTRFLCNVIDKVKDRVGNSLDVTLRMNAYDATPYPYGWGVDQEDFHKPNLEEPIQLIKILQQKGVKLVNISCGNPYYNPHVGRPYDIGTYTPPEHPLQGIAKMLEIIKNIQQAAPEMAVVSTGFTWLREFAANVAAGGIEKGWFTLAGFGRQAFAYPNFARDIIKNGSMDRRKCCTTCSNCTVIMRDGGKIGCVPKDSKIYAPIYKEGRKGKPPIKGDNVAEHV